jgi:hypothetical protein
MPPCYERNELLKGTPMLLYNNDKSTLPSLGVTPRRSGRSATETLV